VLAIHFLCFLLLFVLLVRVKGEPGERVLEA
jgi:hypothetical protein